VQRVAEAFRCFRARRRPLTRGDGRWWWGAGDARSRPRECAFPWDARSDQSVSCIRNWSEPVPDRQRRRKRRNSLDFSLGCFLTPTRRKKSPLFYCTLREYLKKRFRRSVWLPTPLEDVPRRFLDYGNMRWGCPHLSVKLLEVATSSSPVRSAEAESWLKRCVRAGAAFTGSWGQVDAATNGNDDAIPR